MSDGRKKLKVQCEYCKREFWKEDGQHHITICDLNPQNKIQDATIESKKNQVGKFEYRCDIHEQTFSNKSNLLKHMKNVHGIIGRKKEICATIPKFKVITKHDGKEKIKCQRCQGEYSTKTNFMKHVNRNRCTERGRQIYY